MNILKAVSWALLLASIAVLLILYALPSRHLSREAVLIAVLLVSAIIGSILGRRP